MRRRPALAAALTLILTCAGITALSAAPAQAVVDSAVYSSPDGVFWTVPAGVHSIEVEMTGAGGGGGSDVNFPWTDWTLTGDGSGGFGAVITGTMPVTPGETYTFYGSTKGEDLGTTPGGGGVGFRDGGTGHHRSGSGDQRAGGGGGGASAIIGPNLQPVAIAAGGGGGGGRGCIISYFGGHAGHAGGSQDDANGRAAAPDIAIGGGNPGEGGQGAASPGGNGTPGGEAASNSLGGGGGGGGAGYPNGGFGGGGGGAGCQGGGGGGAGGSFVADAFDDLAITQAVEGAELADGSVRISYEAVYATETALTVEADDMAPGANMTLRASVSNVDVDNIVPVGTVQFLLGEDLLLGTGTLTPLGDNAQAVVNTIVPAQTGTITARYLPDSRNDVKFAESQDSAPLEYSVATTTTLKFESTEVVHGQELTAHVTVTPEVGDGPVNGVAEINLPVGASVWEVDVVDGVGDLTFIPRLNASNGTLFTAEYQGSGIYDRSESDPVPVSVERADTSTSLTVDPDQVVVGGEVSVTARVTPVAPSVGGSLALGIVRFTLPDGSTVEKNLGVSEAATITVPAYTVGQPSLRAEYLGFSYYNPSASDELTFEIVPVASTLELDVPAESFVIGETAMLSASVKTHGPGSASTDGTVQFFVNEEPWGEPVEVVDDTATTELIMDEVRDYEVWAKYSGNENRAPATSQPELLSVDRGDVEIALRGSPGSPVAHGAPITLEAELSLVEPADTELGGEVEFFAGDISLGTVPVESDAATLTVNDLPVGDHELRAVYPGEVSSVNGAESEPLPYTVEAGVVTVEVTTAPNPSEQGAEVRIVAVVDPRGESTLAPTGQVVFLLDGEEWQTPIALIDGTAAFTSSDLPVGASLVQARYLGDDGYQEALSTETEHLVTEHATSDPDEDGDPDTPGDDPSDGPDEAPADADNLAATGAPDNAALIALGALLLTVGLGVTATFRTSRGVRQR